MLDLERPPILTEEQVSQFGRDAYERYSADAQNSEVPASFLDYSEPLTQDFFHELPQADIVEIIFETKFDDDREAWLALKYAEAMSAIKTLDLGMQYDSEGPITNKADISNMYMIIGIAAVNEFFGDKTEAVKQRVEDYFETHPQSIMRLDYLKRQAEAGIVH